MKPEVVLWLYLVILVAGGVFAFVKVKSAVSLGTSLVAGVLLALAATHVFPWRYSGDLILAVLVVVFAWRFQKTRKFMPAGMLTVVTIAAVLVRGMMMWG